MDSKTYLHLWQKNPRRNLWQHPLWADFQKAIGRQVWLLQTENTSALVVKHRLPKGLSWLEAPRGPLFEDEKGFSEIITKIIGIGQKEKSIFIRFSPYEKMKIVNCKLIISPFDHHPQTSLILDLSRSEDQILGQMKPKGRYNIKVAEKHGVTVRPSEDVDQFYALLAKTGSRDGFGVHPKSYYQKMLESMPGHTQLLLAEYQGKVIAGGIFVFLNDWGIYYYGASDNDYRNVMAPYLIQWTAIKEAKQRGCRFYDFLGIAPENAKNHTWAGVTEFKKKFGGEVVNYPQAQEVVLRPFWYWIYRMYKKIHS